MARYTICFASLDRLKDQGELGGIIVRLMMALNDFAIANDGMGRWQAEEKPSLQDRRTSASRYFLRQLMAHLFEALEIVREIRDTATYRRAVDICDAETRASFEKLVAFLDTDDYKMLLRIRNNVAFHYDQKVAVKSLQRLAIQFPGKNVTYTLGHDLINWRFAPAELVENDLVVREIFKIPDGDPADQQKSTDDVVVRIHGMAEVFGDFAGYFVKQHAKAW